jgi:peptidyl-prolyl cis-trans isomerase B (cyclophilin B)
VATKRERQRKLARERYQRRLERQAVKQQQTKKFTIAGLAAAGVVVVVLVALLVGGAFSSTPKKKNDAAAKHSTTPSATTTPSASPTPTTNAVETAKHCTYIKGGVAARKVSLPPVKPDAKAKYQATIKTNRGTIVINLLNKQAPCTVGSFVSLVDQKFYNKTPCQRLTTKLSGIYVLQCGDPTGTGEGGPGYGFGNENLPTKVNANADATYPPGEVAMAHSEEPNSNGSQFFLVYKDSPLPPDYTPFGTIASGLNIIQNVAKAGTSNTNGPGDGAPKEKVQIISVTIKKI